MIDDIPFCGTVVRGPFGPRPGLLLPAVLVSSVNVQLGGFGFGR